MKFKALAGLSLFYLLLIAGLVSSMHLHRAPQPVQVASPTLGDIDVPINYGVLGSTWLEAIVSIFDITYKQSLTPPERARLLSELRQLKPIQNAPFPAPIKPTQKLHQQQDNGFERHGTRGPLLAGISDVSIALPMGCPSSGYGDRLLPSEDPLADPYDCATLYKSMEGIHDEIRAKALVMDDGSKVVALVGMDAIGVTGTIHDDVIAGLNSRNVPIGEDDLIIMCTHTHGGPGALAESPFWQLFTVDLFKREIYDGLIDKVAAAIADAYNNRVPAKLGIGSGTLATISHNRRGDPHKYDKELGVIRVDFVDDSPMCVLFNFAIHGTCLGGGNLLYTGDNMGYAERYVEDQLGNGCLAIFANGAEGDVAPNGGGWDGAKRVGETLGFNVLNVRQTITTDPMVSFRTQSEVKTLPMPYIRPGLETSAVPLNLTIPLAGLLDNTARFTALRINDDTVIATLPGEPITEIGWQVKAAANALGFTKAFVFGCAQQHLGYFTTEMEYWQGGYEALITFFGPETEDLVVGFATDMMDDIAP